MDNPSSTPPSDFGGYSQPTDRSALPYAVATAAGLLAGALAVLINYALLAWVKSGDQAVPMLIYGPLVGLAVWLVARRRRDMTTGVIAVTIALAAAVTGFFLGETVMWSPFLWPEAIRRLLSLYGIILLGLTGYLAFLIGGRTNR